MLQGPDFWLLIPGFVSAGMLDFSVIGLGKGPNFKPWD